MNKCAELGFLNSQATAVSIKDTGPSFDPRSSATSKATKPRFKVSRPRPAARRSHAVRPYGEPPARREGAGGVRASRKKSALTIVAAPSVQNAVV